MAAVVLPALVLAHFGLIAATIANPALIPEIARPAVERYLVPIFVQDWRLFAPRPDAHDYAVYARGEYVEEGVRRWTPWLDLLDPLIVTVQANRLSPDGVRLEVTHKAALLTFWSGGPFMQVPSGRAVLAERWAQVERQPMSAVVLSRLAAVALADAHPRHTFDTLQVLLTSRTVGDGGPEDVSALLLPAIPFPEVVR